MSRRSLGTPAIRAPSVDPVATVGLQAPAVRISHRMIVDIVALVDVALVILSAALAKLLYIAVLLEDDQLLQPYLVAGLAGGVVLHYVTRSRGLQDAGAIANWTSRVHELLVSIGLAFLIVIAIAYLLKISATYSRGWLLSWLGLTTLSVIASRSMFAHLLSWLAAGGYTARRIAVVGSGRAGEQLVHTLRRTPGIEVVGMFTDASAEGQVESGIAELITRGQRNEIDEVVIAQVNSPGRSPAQLVDELSVLPVDVWLCPTELDLPILAIGRLGAISLLHVKPRPIREWGYLVKLAFDYGAGSLSLLLLSPLMLAVALAIKLDSQGPVFFRQRRHGFNHRVIYVYKFRTMTVAEDGSRIEQARKDDPRVTRVGRLLRSTSLDELPQLFNVMRGEMSLVGPRPHALAHNHYYRERLDRYASRHRVKPGMTGWAQVHGLRGPTEDSDKMRRRVQMDLYYIEHWSLWLDLKIIALTPFVGFVHANAL